MPKCRCARRSAQPLDVTMIESPSESQDALVAPASALAPLPKHTSYEEPIRGGWLTFLLAAKVVANVVSAATYLFVICGVLSLEGRGPLVALVYLVLVMTNITAIAAIWNWQRWGLYLLAVIAIVIFAVNLSVGLLRWSTAIGLVGPLVIFAAMWPSWKSFE
jgi:hypothetical protein